MWTPEQRIISGSCRDDVSCCQLGRSEIKCELIVATLKAKAYLKLVKSFLSLNAAWKSAFVSRERLNGSGKRRLSCRLTMSKGQLNIVGTYPSRNCSSWHSTAASLAFCKTCAFGPHLFCEKSLMESSAWAFVRLPWENTWTALEGIGF